MFSFLSKEYFLWTMPTILPSAQCKNWTGCTRPPWTSTVLYSGDYLTTAIQPLPCCSSVTISSSSNPETVWVKESRGGGGEIRRSAHSTSHEQIDGSLPSAHPITEGEALLGSQICSWLRTCVHVAGWNIHRRPTVIYTRCQSVGNVNLSCVEIPICCVGLQVICHQLQNITTR